MRNIFMKMLWVEGYKESTLSQPREDLIVESDSSINEPNIDMGKTTLD